MSKIGAAIIAGGANIRFQGRNKALLKVFGEPILTHNIKVLRPLFDELHLISNNPAAYSNYDLPVFTDFFEGIGPLGGIYSALFNSNCEAVFIFSCDMPFLSADLINKIIEHFLKIRPDIIIPQILDKIEPLHAIYSTALLPSLEEHIRITTTYKIRLFFNKANTSYITIEDTVENQKAFFNINSPDDLHLIS